MKATRTKFTLVVLALIASSCLMSEKAQAQYTDPGGGGGYLLPGEDVDPLFIELLVHEGWDVLRQAFIDNAVAGQEQFGLAGAYPHYAAQTQVSGHYFMMAYNNEYVAWYLLDLAASGKLQSDAEVMMVLDLSRDYAEAAYQQANYGYYTTPFKTQTARHARDNSEVAIELLVRLTDILHDDPWLLPAVQFP